MRVTADNDYVLLERFIPPSETEFVTTGIESDSPFFVVVAVDETASSYSEGTQVIPRPDRLIPVKIDGKQYYFVEEHDIMGENHE